MSSVTDTQALEAQLYMQAARRAAGHPRARRRRTRVWDDDGKEYLDFVAGISTNTFGHADPELAAGDQRSRRTR